MTKPRIEIWAENIQELLYFKDKIIKGKQIFNIQNLFVAKGAQGIGGSYLMGKYREYSYIECDTLDTIFTAPGAVTDLVQWCCPDIIITKDRKPILSLEITYHKPTWNNVAQRLPRLVRAAACRIPSIIFHKCEQTNPKKSWVAEVYRKVTKIYDIYTLPIFFSERDFDEKRLQLVKICNEITEQKKSHKEIMSDVFDETFKIASCFSQDEFEFGKNGLRRRWLPRITDDLIEVHISVKQQCGNEVCQREKCRNDLERVEMRNKIKVRDKKTQHGCMWLTKGTGGLDPYPGLIKLAEILCSYNKHGQRIRNVLTKFRELNEDFWWFQKYADRLYYRLIKEFSDEIIYKGQTRTLFTQSSMILKTRKFLSSTGWTILYDDLPGGSRSGIGNRAKIFQIFTQIYRAYPDLICLKNEKLLIVEVDNVLNDECVKKLHYYLSKSTLLKQRLSTILEREVRTIDVAFSRVKGRYRSDEKVNKIKRFFQDESLQICIDS